jgi:pantoate--beta-alanine ligase
MSRKKSVFMIKIVRTLSDLRAQITEWRDQSHTIGLVPTMGALHDGHLDLVRAGKEKVGRVVTSIFVNPTQFAAHEDLGRYPRDEAGDLHKLERMGCDLVYAPDLATIYPVGFSTQVSVSGITQRLEGTFRPQFFAGVTTVVAKLLLQASPDIALFGEKDWQQLQVVTKMVADLDLGVSIIGVPTRREGDGLAMSSRNAYLSPEERAAAPALKAALDNVAQAALSDPATLTHVIADAKAAVLAAGFAFMDYLEPCHASTLEPWKAGEPLRVFAAAWLGKTRLIDNVGA